MSNPVRSLAEGAELSAAWLLERCAIFGITRLADITGLDRLGIPCHAATIVNGSDIISSYSGKGVTQAVSRISAMMEAIERNASAWDTIRVRFASTTQLVSERTRHVPPEDFTEQLASDYRGGESVISWVAAHDVTAGHEFLVPAELAFSGYPPSGYLQHRAFSTTTSNGLAAGFDLDQAVQHGIREVLERDIVSLCELRAVCFDAGFLEAIARKFGVDVGSLGRSFQCRPGVGVRIEPRTLPHACRAIYDRFAAIGVRVAIRALPNDLGLPAFGACAAEQLSQDNWLCGAGYGVHTDPGSALEGALVEIAQGRATSLQGAREDYHAGHLKSRFASMPRSDWLFDDTGELASFEDVGRLFSNAGAEHCVANYCSAARAVGLDRVLSVTFTHLPVPAVRILIPGVETTHPTQGYSRLGQRATSLRV